MITQVHMFIKKAYRYVRFRRERNVIDNWIRTVDEVKAEKESEEEKGTAEVLEDVEYEKTRKSDFRSKAET